MAGHVLRPLNTGEVLRAAHLRLLREVVGAAVILWCCLLGPLLRLLAAAVGRLRLLFVAVLLLVLGLPRLVLQVRLVLHLQFRGLGC